MIEVKFKLCLLGLSFNLYFFTGNQLTDVDAWHLVEPLKTNTSLTSLDLSNNNFGELGGIYLGGALVSKLISLLRNKE